MGAKTSSGKDPYFFIINPYTAENQDEKWADFLTHPCACRMQILSMTGGLIFWRPASHTLHVQQHF